ncbi:unnamed protein product [Peniophora sp. CBMAI 1063]|nr:unnamed protein product [Peniophora sp. CBMAI 1063]
MGTIPPPQPPLRTESDFIRVDMSAPRVAGSRLPPQVGEAGYGQSGTTFIDPQDKFWSLYLSDAEKYDNSRLESWRGDADGILIFTGLFAATVATFTVASYSMLFPDPNEQTAALLTTLIALNVNGSQAITIPVPPVFQASTAAVCINALWIISLFLSLACALAATLVQQWARRYAHHVQQRAPPRDRGPLHVVLSMGLRRFGMKQAVAAIICTLHLSVALFLAGLGIYMSSANDTIAFVVAGVMGVGALGYGFLSILPLACTDSPYKTPFTPVLRLCITLACNTFAYCCDLAATLVWFTSRKGQHERLTRRATAISKWTATLKGERIKYAKDLAKRPTTAREKFALKQTMKDLDEVHELETFCDALIVLVQPNGGSRWDEDLTMRVDLTIYLLEELHIKKRIAQLLLSKPTPAEPNPRGVRVRRISIGLKLARALVAAIAHADHRPNLVRTIQKCLGDELLASWRSTAANEKYSCTAFLARSFLSTVRVDVCRHYLLASSANGALDAVGLAANLSLAEAHAPGRGEIRQHVRSAAAKSMIQSYLCEDYVRFLRDILSFESRDHDLLDMYAGTWFPLFVDVHNSLCMALDDLDGTCLDMLQAVLMHVNMCHRQADGTLFDREYTSMPNYPGLEVPRDEYRDFFSRYPDIAGLLHDVWSRIKNIRSDGLGFYCTCYYHLHLPEHEPESAENSLTTSTDSDVTLSHPITLPSSCATSS